jgi:hypothetical protein
MTKGLLVLLMVVYHSLNYTNEYHLAFRYLSFLPPSFILITGFLISTVYSGRFATDRAGLTVRLVVRGVKLLALFTVLNIAAQYVRSPSYGRSVGIEAFFQQWKQVYFIGSGRIAVFEVLLPIAYLIIAAPLLILLGNRYRLFLPSAAFLGIALCSLLDRWGYSLANLNLFSAGLLGILIGKLMPDLSILRRYLLVGLVAYAVYFAVALTKGYLYLVQLSGACIVLGLLCGVTAKIEGQGWWRNRLILAGQYSLLAYISQIGLLQTFSRLLGRPDPLSVGAVVLFVGTIILMTLGVELTHWVRNRSPKVEFVYRAVFA